MQEDFPRVMMLLSEADVLITRLDSRLSHTLLPSYPVPQEGMNKIGEAESNLTATVRNIVRRLSELNERVEG